MARHDDRKRIVAERLTNGPRGARIAERGRQFAIRAGLTGRDRSRDLVDASVERGHVVHVQHDAGEIVLPAGEQCGDARDRLSDRGRRGRLLCAGAALANSGARPLFGRLRQLHARHTTIGPGEAANADRGWEKRVVH